MIIVGLTGGIATGKSTVSSLLKDNGWSIIDADLVAKEVLEPQGAAYDSVVKTFTPLAANLVDSSTGAINREALGALVFRDKVLLKKLNSITHPAIIKTIIKSIIWNWWHGTTILILDVPLLFEAKMHWLCHSVVVVSCDEETQLQRLMIRNPHLTQQQAIDRINAQMPLKTKESLASIVIQNNSTRESLNAKVVKLVDYVTSIRWSILTYLQTHFLHKNESITVL